MKTLTNGKIFFDIDGPALTPDGFREATDEEIQLRNGVVKKELALLKSEAETFRKSDIEVAKKAVKSGMDLDFVSKSMRIPVSALEVQG